MLGRFLAKRMPVRDKKVYKNNDLEARSDSIGSGKVLASHRRVVILPSNAVALLSRPFSRAAKTLWGKPPGVSSPSDFHDARRRKANSGIQGYIMKSRTLWLSALALVSLCAIPPARAEEPAAAPAATAPRRRQRPPP